MVYLFKYCSTKLLWVLLATFTLFSCSKTDDGPKPSKPAVTNDLVVDPAITYQTIAGFGGANQMWGTTFPNASDMKKAFGMGENELGMSIFRVRIASNPSEWPLIVNVCKEALKHGAIILACPWSPPPSLKSNGNEVGGFLLEENYGAFVDHLNDFIAFMAGEGVEIYAISIQNEPDIKVSYESCDWSPSAMRNFIRDYGHLITGSKLAAPESFNFNQSFTNVLLNDKEALKNLDIVAGHIYGGGLAPFPLAEENDKEVWMTEYLLNKDATSNWAQLSEDVIWDESLEMLRTVHESMRHNWNAYIWWYLKRYYSFIGDGDQGTQSGEILKRGYAFSHFSRFIRPGYVRIDAKLERFNALVSAYQGEGKTVIVLINLDTIPIPNISLPVSESGVSVTAYSTSLHMNRTSSEIVANEDGKFIINLIGKSVTTVVIE